MNTPQTAPLRVPGVGAPNVDINRPFHIWKLSEVYDDSTKNGVWVPNVDDLIVDLDKNFFRRVTYVNYTTFEYDWVVWKNVGEANSDAEIGGCGPHTSDSFRIYVDPSKFPMTLRVDSRLTFKGSDNDRIQIFKGTDISLNGQVISATIKNGVVAGNSIPLELAAIDHVENHTIKNAAPGHCSVEVLNGELVTIVAYGDNDQVTAIARAYIILTNMVMAAEAPARQIRKVELVSPFLSPSDDKLLELPINIPLDDIPLYYRVTYNDGIVEETIDNTRCSLTGLRNSGAHDNFYISTLSGQELDLVLSYKLARNETYVGDNLFGDTICIDYRATTLPVDGAYSVKLFVVPQWIDAARGYRLHYYLYNLERGNVFDATPYVTMGVNTPAFDPVLYGIKQHITVTCNLGQVSPVYNSHVHVQTFAITLLAQGNMRQDNYLIEYNPGQEAYGEGLAAKFDYDNVKYWRLDLTCGARDKAEWLHRMYRNIYPLFDRRTEDKAPEPTHFEIVIGDKSYMRDVNDWMTNFNIEFEIRASQHVMIRWICRTPHDDLQLGMSPLLAKQIG